MIKNKSGYFRLKSVKFIAIPLLLGFISLLLSLVFTFASSQNPVFHVEYESPKTFSDVTTQNELLSSDVVRGELKALSNYLGIVKVRFTNFGRINDNTVIFRVKEKNQKQWYYENEYKTNQFQDHGYFPFGFPPIQDSMNKEFVFEITSENATPGDAVGISSISPNVSTVYEIPFLITITDTSRFIRMVMHSPFDFLLAITHAFIFDTLLLSAFFFPILLYLFIILFFDRRGFSILFPMLVGTSIVYVFLGGKLPSGSESVGLFIIIVLITMLVTLIRKHKLPFVVYVYLAIFYLVFMIFLLVLFNRPDFANRAANFGYAFMLIGTISGLCFGYSNKGNYKHLRNNYGVERVLQLMNFIRR